METVYVLMVLALALKDLTENSAKNNKPTKDVLVRIVVIQSAPEIAKRRQTPRTFGTVTPDAIPCALNVA